MPLADLGVATLDQQPATAARPRQRRVVEADQDPAAREAAAVEVTGHPPPQHHPRSEEHTSELQSPCTLVCRLLLEKKNTKTRAQRQPVDASARTPAAGKRRVPSRPASRGRASPRRRCRADRRDGSGTRPRATTKRW